MNNINMNNPEQQPTSNLQFLETELSLTKAEMEEFRKLPKEEQDRQKDEKLEKLKALQEKLDHAIQEAIQTGNIEEVKILKETLNKEITDLEEIFNTTKPEIQVKYTYINKDTGVLERQETVTMDIEKKLEEFLSFYKKTNIELPADFEETIKDIWNRNQSEIEQSIQDKGFDEMLLIPGNIPLADLAEKMKMESGYYFYQVKEDFSDVKSQKVDKPRIILFHHMDSLPEIAQKTGLDIHLNITGADAQKLYQANPEDYFGTLEDSIILERKYFEDTAKHLSDYKNKSAQWLPGSKVGARLVRSYWNGDRELSVSAYNRGYQDDDCGVRPSHIFF